MAERKKEDFLDERLERRVAELEKKIDRMGKRAGERLKTVKGDIHDGRHQGHVFFWGIVLIVVGIIWLGNNLEWFVYEIPWISVIMIAAGVYIIFKNWEKKEPSDGDESSGRKK